MTPERQETRIETEKAPPRIVSHFSCGAASAVATKLVLSEYPPERVVIVNAYLKEEHPDNRRFLDECEQWFEHPIVRLADTKYGASAQAVWKASAGIELPMMYRLGYNNNNCIGCCKGGEGYWNKIDFWSSGGAKRRGSDLPVRLNCHEPTC